VRNGHEANRINLLPLQPGLPHDRPEQVLAHHWRALRPRSGLCFASVPGTLYRQSGARPQAVEPASCETRAALTADSHLVKLDFQ